jgi:hypothetical protein
VNELIEDIAKMREVAMDRLRGRFDEALEIRKGLSALPGGYDEAILDYICQGRSDEWIADLLTKTVTPDYVP